MDPTTRAHVTGKVDMDTVGFAELRQVVQSFCNLIVSTNTRGRGGGVIAMDIGAIASVAGAPGGYVISDAAAQEENDQNTMPAV